MPWGRCDDKFYRHPKVLLLSEEHRKGALCLFWLAISWCNDNLTDGRVPTGAVRVLGADVVEAEALVGVGLWEKEGDHYRVHDFLAFNKSREQVESERAQRTAAGRAGGLARSASLSGSLSTSLDDAPSDELSGSPAPVTRNPLPVSSTPSPLALEGPLAREGLPNITPLVANAIEAITGRSLLQAGHKQLTELDRLIEDHGATIVVNALNTVAAGQRMTSRQLVWGAMKYLEPIPVVRPPEPEKPHAHRFFGYPTRRCECGEERSA